MSEIHPCLAGNFPDIWATNCCCDNWQYCHTWHFLHLLSISKIFAKWCQTHTEVAMLQECCLLLQKQRCHSWAFSFTCLLQFLIILPSLISWYRNFLSKAGNNQIYSTKILERWNILHLMKKCSRELNMSKFQYIYVNKISYLTHEVTEVCGTECNSHDPTYLHVITLPDD